MTTKDDGGPAFPSDVKRMQVERGGELVPVGYYGMTLRDYFAAHVVAALVTTRGGPFADLSELAYGVADAMLAERAK